MKKASIAIALGIFLVMTAASAYAGYEVFQGPTELIQYDSSKAYNGYSLLLPGFGGVTAYLLDMEGQVVHTWENGGYKLTDDGYHYVGGFGATISELDWDGNVVWGPWSFPESRTDEALPHHDSWKIYDTKLGADAYIGIFYFTATNEEIWAAGGDPSIDYATDGRNTSQDAIFEIDRDGNLIWEWKLMDHTIQDRNPEWPNYVGEGKSISDYPGKCDIFWQTNESAPDGPDGVVDDWHHCNSLHYNGELGHVCVNAKRFSEFYVIDQANTFVPGDYEQSKMLAASDEGDFIYRWGNPSAYQQGDPPAFEDEGDQQMYGSHNIHWIDEDIPGGGNFLIFNNGCYNPLDNHSEIIEINPFLDADGNDTGWYVNPPEAGYDSSNRSTQIAWLYESNSPNAFYSNFISGCQRLPNGNTFICSGAHGHFFEVTTDGEVVWEYINPFVGGMVGSTISTTASDSNVPGCSFRIMRFSPDHPAFEGRDLTPMGTITGSTGGGTQTGSFRWHSYE